MATGITNNFTMSLFNAIFGRSARKLGFRRSSFQLSQNFLWDSFSSNRSNQILQGTVKKMQSALQITSLTVKSGTISFNAGRNAVAAEQAAPAPTQQEIDQAVKDAGGMDALSTWLVDGKTKINVNGRKVVAQVGQAGGTAAATTAEEARAQAEKSLQRFGMDASALDKPLDRVREDLQQAASKLSANDPGMGLAIEYALEDAFAKLSAWETASQGTTDSAAAYEAQRKTNKEQAAAIVSQLGLGNGNAWGIESMGEDLAVFGLDFTAMSQNPYELAETIRTKSKEMLADLESRYVGTEAEFIQERNRITGASARLANGLEGAAVFTLTSSSMTGEFSGANVKVSVNGTKVDASSIIAVGNVIVDPLVFDLQGDGIDLSSAEEGVEFDMNGDGEKTGMGFIRGDDALLFLDTHGDGIVHDGRQLFGNTSGYANGYEMLREYDENGDGVIDENDSIYDQLMLWQEKTEDGICEREETMTLREAGIKSINLNYENTREDDGKGNLIGQTGSFTRDDGSEGYSADVWLRGRTAEKA